MATKKRKCRSIKKGGKNNKTKKCMDTKCKLWLKQAAKNTEIFKKTFEDAYKKGVLKVEKECKKKGMKQEVCEKMKKELEFIKKVLDNFKNKKLVADSKKFELEICRSRFCNEGCKGTILEDGPADTLPKEILVKFKSNPAAIDMFKKMRKEIFGNKTSVLKDNFFEGMKAADKEKYIKEGSISGCIRS